MKLLLYSHFFAPNIGGVETLVLSLARGLSQLRRTDGQPQFEITLITQTSASDYEDQLLPFTVIRQPARGQLWRRIRSTDVLHVAGTAILPIFLGRLARKPVIVEHHGFQAICPNGQLLIEPSRIPCPGHFMAGHYTNCLRCNSGSGWRRSLRQLALTFARRWLCAGVAANITPTHWLGNLVQLPRVAVIPHGLDESPRPRTRAHTVDPPIIVFVGRLVTTKGAATLIEAASILRQARSSFTVLVVGDGPERGALEAQVEAGQLSEVVKFAGRLQEAELRETLSAVSIAAVPSIGGEVFGLVVAENMLSGLPVVASDLGAFTEVLGDTGLTFEAGNAPALARQLTRLINDVELRIELGRRATQRAEEYCNLQRMLESHARIYRGAFGDDSV
jgi:glycosyltransferase involved in cell wall biosynthesis